MEKPSKNHRIGGVSRIPEKPSHLEGTLRLEPRTDNPCARWTYVTSEGVHIHSDSIEELADVIRAYEEHDAGGEGEK